MFENRDVPLLFELGRQPYVGACSNLPVPERRIEASLADVRAEVRLHSLLHKAKLRS